MSTALADHRSVEILLVEDKQNDAILAREAFRAVKPEVRLHFAKDGMQCMAYLRKEDAFAGAPTPDLILLDLNMPKMDGRDVLLEIAKDERLRHMPVIILTTSSEPGEVLELYRLRCSSYIVKPLDFHEFARIAQSICDYWSTVVNLPTH